MSRNGQEQERERSIRMAAMWIEGVPGQPNDKLCDFRCLLFRNLTCLA